MAVTLQSSIYTGYVVKLDMLDRSAHTLQYLYSIMYGIASLCFVVHLSLVRCQYYAYSQQPHRQTAVLCMLAAGVHTEPNGILCLQCAY
jgi:hypothetical protein